PDITHGGTALLVYAQRGAIHLEQQGFQTIARRAGTAPHSNQDLLDRQYGFLVLVGNNTQAIAGFGQAADAVGQIQDYAQLLQGRLNGLEQVSVVGGQNAILCLDDADLDAQLGIGHAQLQPYVAGSDHGQLLGQAGRRQGLGRRNDRAAKGHEGQFDRLGASGQQQMLAAETLWLAGFVSLVRRTRRLNLYGLAV